MNGEEFWRRVHEAARKATWAYLATADGQQPKVRVVHPAFEGERVWIATGRNSHKARQIQKNPRVELFYQLGPELVHLTVTGTARFIDDMAEKKRVWSGKIFDYDLAQFWPGGPESPDFGLLLIAPTRVELTTLADITQGAKPDVWRPAKRSPSA
jgi:general stress protein 26